MQYEEHPLKYWKWRNNQISLKWIGKFSWKNNCIQITSRTELIKTPTVDYGLLFIVRLQTNFMTMRLQVTNRSVFMRELSFHETISKSLRMVHAVCNALIGVIASTDYSFGEVDSCLQRTRLALVQNTGKLVKLTDHL